MDCCGCVLLVMVIAPCPRHEHRAWWLLHLAQSLSSAHSSRVCSPPRPPPHLTYSSPLIIPSLWHGSPAVADLHLLALIISQEEHFTTAAVSASPALTPLRSLLSHLFARHSCHSVRPAGACCDACMLLHLFASLRRSASLLLSARCFLAGSASLSLLHALISITQVFETYQLVCDRLETLRSSTGYEPKSHHSRRVFTRSCDPLCLPRRSRTHSSIHTRPRFRIHICIRSHGEPRSGCRQCRCKRIQHISSCSCSSRRVTVGWCSHRAARQ